VTHRDTEFRGFLAQKFQVHGTPNTVYDLLSAAHVQLNSRFVFIGPGQARCTPEVRDTQCWTHPGSSAQSAQCC
jgi:hypothetical protein